MSNIDTGSMSKCVRGSLGQLMCRVGPFFAVGVAVVLSWGGSGWLLGALSLLFLCFQFSGDVGFVFGSLFGLKFEVVFSMLLVTLFADKQANIGTANARQQ